MNGSYLTPLITTILGGVIGWLSAIMAVRISNKLQQESVKRALRKIIVADIRTLNNMLQSDCVHIVRGGKVALFNGSGKKLAVKEYHTIKSKIGVLDYDEVNQIVGLYNILSYMKEYKLKDNMYYADKADVLELIKLTDSVASALEGRM